MLTREAAKSGIATVGAGRAERGFRSLDGRTEVGIVVVESVIARRGWRTTQHKGARNEDEKNMVIENATNRRQKQGGRTTREPTTLICILYSRNKFSRVSPINAGNGMVR